MLTITPQSVNYHGKYIRIFEEYFLKSDFLVILDERGLFWYRLFIKRAIAQLVSVQVWGTWGPGFEFRLPDFYKKDVGFYEIDILFLCLLSRPYSE